MEEVASFYQSFAGVRKQRSMRKIKKKKKKKKNRSNPLGVAAAS